MYVCMYLFSGSLVPFNVRSDIVQLPHCSGATDVGVRGLAELWTRSPNCHPFPTSGLPQTHFLWTHIRRLSGLLPLFWVRTLS